MNTNLVTYANVEVMKYNMLRSYGIDNVCADSEKRIDDIIACYEFADFDLEFECTKFLIDYARQYLMRHAIISGDFIKLKPVV